MIYFICQNLPLQLSWRSAKAREEESIFRIKSVDDVYHALTNEEVLEKVLYQGLKEEHKQYKDNIVVSVHEYER